MSFPLSRRSVKALRYRQIHLDFHTSEHIPNVGADFNPDDFVATLKAAHVDSVTLFAKCHHGWSYYQTAVGRPHPNLMRPDLLGDMVKVLVAVDIECPIYITVQWDELSAREHPEWRVLSANNRYHRELGDDVSALKQLSPAWHTLCLNHAPLRQNILAQAREVAERYHPPGLFFDIVMATDCVCPACIERMLEQGLDPKNAVHRRQNDEAVNEQFRQEISSALSAEFPEMRVFYNKGHIDKKGRERFKHYSHLELESLPTGGWGYDHFPTSARYAATLGMDFLGQTGKFHTSWGEFGGFKQPQALEYEAAQMVSLGAKCLVGDQLHPSGAINHDTYKSIAAAYERVRKLEPFLTDARQVSEVAILSAEHMNQTEGRNHPSDDGAAQMLLELKLPFDVIDRNAHFEDYRLIILPDEIQLDVELAARFERFVDNGGKLVLSWQSGLNTPDSLGTFMIDVGLRRNAQAICFDPSYIKASPMLDAQLPESAFVMYDTAESVSATTADVLADIYPSYFNRSYRHFSSHQHAPDDIAAAPLGVAVSVHRGVAYIAYPIFRLYRAMGQPLYKYIVRGLLNRLLPTVALRTDLPSSGRATLTYQAQQKRYVLHLLYGAPQVRGKAVPREEGVGMRVMEVIEDVPAIGPVSATLRLPHTPIRCYDAISGEEVNCSQNDDGGYTITLPRLHLHAAIVFEGL